MSAGIKQKKSLASHNSAKAKAICNTLVQMENERRYHEMIALGERSLVQHPHDETILSAVGIAYRKLGNHDQAITYLNQSLTVNPANPAILFHLGMLMMEHERYDYAIGMFESALQHDPDHEPSIAMLPLIHSKQGHFSKLVVAAMYALKRYPKSHTYWHHLDQGLIQLGSRQSSENFVLPKSFQDFVVSQVPLLDQANHGLTAVCMKQLFFTDNIFNTHVGRILDGGVAALAEEAEKPGFLHDLHHPLFMGLLDVTRVSSLLFENVLKAIRYALLRASVETDRLNLSLDSEGETVVSRLAKYFFRVEYLPDVTPEEQSWLTRLEEKLTGSGSENPPPNLTLAMLYGMYHSLYRLHGRIDIDGLREAAEKSKRAKEIIKILYDDLEEEEAIKSEIKVFSSFQNTISQKVQEQYEENPYPRWDLLPPTDPFPASELLNVYVPMHRSASIRIPRNPEVLVAGCGTGQQPLSAGCTLPSATFLNADLSKSSLAYAIRKTRELGLTEKHAFIQADILELGLLDRQFDIVECSGVLHHMENPMAGWQVLTNLVRPGGLMEIGLYSQSARQQIIRAREQVRQKGYPETIEGLRAFRQECSRDPDSFFTLNADFYSSSALRDLIFHRQEHQFTIPQIKSCLDTLGLRFVGFIVNGDIYERYIDVLPFSRDFDDLDNWARVEEKHPYMFFGMYQFYCYKPA